MQLHAQKEGDEDRERGSLQDGAGPVTFPAQEL